MPGAEKRSSTLFLVSNKFRVVLKAIMVRIAKVVLLMIQAFG